MSNNRSPIRLSSGAPYWSPNSIPLYRGGASASTAAAAFDPSTLFAIDSIGDYWDTHVATKMFSDLAETTAVTDSTKTLAFQGELDRYSEHQLDNDVTKAPFMQYDHAMTRFMGRNSHDVYVDLSPAAEVLFNSGFCYVGVAKIIHGTFRAVMVDIAAPANGDGASCLFNLKVSATDVKASIQDYQGGTTTGITPVPENTLFTWYINREANGNATVGIKQSGGAWETATVAKGAAGDAYSADVRILETVSPDNDFLCGRRIFINRKLTPTELTDAISYVEETGTDLISAGTYAYIAPNDNGGLTVSNSNHTVSAASTNWFSARGAFGFSTGKKYFEATLTGSNHIVGVATLSATVYGYCGADEHAWGYNSSGDKFHNGASSAFGGASASGDTVGFIVDCDAGTIEFVNKLGVNVGVMYSGLSGTLYPFLSTYTTGDSVLLNGGHASFVHGLPSGCTAWVRA